jgi:S-methylmethionine-dependent homocysteine/selenocysteine methylase
MFELTVLDGGAGRELARMGAPFRQPEWSALALMEGPDFVTRMHGSFIAAGADVITTNSYAVVPFHIGAARFASRGEALADLAGRLARQAVADASCAAATDAARQAATDVARQAAADARRPAVVDASRAVVTDAGRPAVTDAARRVKVAGSLPPVCGSYRADLFRPDEARPILQTLVRGLAPHVDHWQGETLSAIEEAELVREVIDATGGPARPLWLSFTLEDEAHLSGQPRLRSGQLVGNAVAAAIRLEAAAVLFNCSQPEVMGEAVFAARKVIEDSGAALEVGVYANAFPPQSKDASANAELSEIRSDLTPQAYLAFARAWRGAGASILGGCCGIGPEHIAALRQGLASA